MSTIGTTVLVHMSSRYVQVLSRILGVAHETEAAILRVLNGAFYNCT